MRRVAAVTLVSRLRSRTRSSPPFNLYSCSTTVFRIKGYHYHSSSESSTPSTPPPPPLSPPPSLLDQHDESRTTTTTTSAQSRVGDQPQAQRRRHRFATGGTADEIPSFRDFQQKKQIWSLYRQFTRLIYQSTTKTIDDSNIGSNSSNSNSNNVQTQRSEMQGKIQNEFRLPQSDSWHIQRALSEGSRRYKELSAMLGNSVKRKHAVFNDSSITSGPTEGSTVVPASSKQSWPWNRSVHDTIGKGKPPVFPRKSNG